MKRTHLQQLTAIAKRAHAWGQIKPLSQILGVVGSYQRVTYHAAVYRK